jgi:hypothetical protein
MRRVAIAVIIIMLLLGIQRSPEAQVGEIVGGLIGIGATIVIGSAVGSGCAHMTATQRPEADLTIQSTQTEAPATMP